MCLEKQSKNSELKDGGRWERPGFFFFIVQGTIKRLEMLMITLMKTASAYSMEAFSEQSSKENLLLN